MYTITWDNLSPVEMIQGDTFKETLVVKQGTTSVPTSTFSGGEFQLFSDINGTAVCSGTVTSASSTQWEVEIARTTTASLSGMTSYYYALEMITAGGDRHEAGQGLIYVKNGFI